MKAFTKRRPVTAFIVFTFVITWVLGPLFGFLLGPVEEVLGFENRPLSLFTLKFGPTLAGFFCVWLISGKEGFIDLLSKGAKWKASFGVILVSVCIPLVLILLLVLFWAGEFAGQVFTFSALGILIPVAATKIFLGGGFGEEFGWRGFLLPALENRFSPLVSSLFIAVIWIIWHLPMLALGGDIGNPIIFAVTLTGYSIILTWIYHASQKSVLWVAIFHGWTNALSNSLDKILGDSLSDIEFLFNTGYAAGIIVVASVLLLKYGTNLGRKEIPKEETV